jgi:hypothetical protein
MLFRLVILSCLYLVLSGCSSDDPTRNNTFVPLTSIAVTGTYETMADQTVNQYRAIGNFSGSFTRDITTEVSWSMEDENISSVSNDTGSQGLVNALAPGETSVTAWYGDISGSAPVIVKDVSLTAIAITPQGAEHPIGISQQYEAVGTFSDSSTQNITVLATWESSDPNVATIDNSGLATTLASGSTTITGTWQDVASSANLLVTEATLSAIAITPEVTKIAQYTTVQFQAEGIYTDGETRNFTEPLDWLSADNSIAIVDRNGLAEGIAPGQVEISASFDNDGTTLSDTFVLTITGAVIESIKVTPENSTIQVGETLQYTATGTFSDNTQRDITRDVTWLTSDSSAGSISNSSVSRGLFTSIGAGTTFIEAFLNNVGDQTLLTVE